MESGAARHLFVIGPSLLRHTCTLCLRYVHVESTFILEKCTFTMYIPETDGASITEQSRTRGKPISNRLLPGLLRACKRNVSVAIATPYCPQTGNSARFRG